MLRHGACDIVKINDDELEFLQALEIFRKAQTIRLLGYGPGSHYYLREKWMLCLLGLC